MKKTVNRAIIRIKGDARDKVRDAIATEIPLTVFVNESEIVTLLCSPIDLDSLAVGFLFSEGIVKTADDVAGIRKDEQKGIIAVTLAGEIPAEAEIFEHRALTSGCGRGTMFYTFQDERGLKKCASRAKFGAKQIRELARELQRKSELFASTGAVHSAALSRGDGLDFIGEDIGRHNAVDKVIGKALMARVETAGCVLISSGRISSEILIKTARAGIPVLVSRAAPTNLAIRFAERLGITLVGFARGDRMNVYTYPGRIA